MSLVLTAPQSGNYAPPATIKPGLHQTVISNIEDLGMVALSADILAKNKAQAVKEGRDPNSVKTEQPKARFFFSDAAGEFISKDYTVSLNDRSGLKKDLDAIGKVMKYGDTLLSLIGTQVQAFAINKTSAKGKVYVTIGTLAPPAPGQNVTIPSPAPSTPKQGTGVVATVAPGNTSVKATDIPY